MSASASKRTSRRFRKCYSLVLVQLPPDLHGQIRTAIREGTPKKQNGLLRPIVALATVSTGKETETFVGVPSAGCIEWLQSFLNHFYGIALDLIRAVERVRQRTATARGAAPRAVGPRATLTRRRWLTHKQHKSEEGKNWSFAKWRLGLLWEGTISFLEFFFPIRNDLSENNWRRFFQEIEE